jgi:hypothetical protein
MSSYFRGKVKIESRIPFPTELLVSAERASQFKNWLERGTPEL